MLSNAGCLLSFGAALFRENNHAAESLQQTPVDRFFLETDVSDLSIENIYERAADVRSISPDDLKRQVEVNFKALFL